MSFERTIAGDIYEVASSTIDGTIESSIPPAVTITPYIFGARYL
jgi:hypothetical protein